MSVVFEVKSLREASELPPPDQTITSKHGGVMTLVALRRPRKGRLLVKLCRDSISDRGVKIMLSEDLTQEIAQLNCKVKRGDVITMISNGEYWKLLTLVKMKRKRPVSLHY